MCSPSSGAQGAVDAGLVPLCAEKLTHEESPELKVCHVTAKWVMWLLSVVMWLVKGVMWLLSAVMWRVNGVMWPLSVVIWVTCINCDWWIWSCDLKMWSCDYYIVYFCYDELYPTLKYCIYALSLPQELILNTLHWCFQADTTEGLQWRVLRISSCRREGGREGEREGGEKGKEGRREEEKKHITHAM